MENVAQPRDVLKRSCQLGARAAELLYSSSSGLDVVVDQGRVVRRQETVDEQFSVRVWLDEGQMGIARGSLAAWESLVKKALKAAQKSAANTFSGPVKGWATADEGLGIDDRRFGQLTEEDKVDVVMNAVREARQTERRVETTGFRYSDGRTRRILANTKGVLLQEWSTLYSTKGVVSAPQADLSVSGGLDARTFSGVASLPYGVLLAKRVSALLKTEMSVDGQIRVFLPARVTAHIFGVLAPHFTEASLKAGKTFLSKGVGVEGFFDHRILMLDDGTSVGGVRTRSFDDRGVAPVPLTLIREGMIDRSFLSVEGARARDTRATGHASGDTWSPTNLRIRGGTRSLNALMAEMDEVVFMMDHLRDFERGFGIADGKIDCRCSGWLMRKGKVLGAVRNARLQGNLVDTLRQLVSLSSDTDRHGHVDAPGMVVDGLQVFSA